VPGVGLNSPTELSDPAGLIALRCIIVIDVFLLSLIACVRSNDPGACRKDSVMLSGCCLRKYMGVLYFFFNYFRKTSTLMSTAVALS
jgi:hypothetical protein